MCGRPPATDDGEAVGTATRMFQTKPTHRKKCPQLGFAWVQAAHASPSHHKLKVSLAFGQHVGQAAHHCAVPQVDFGSRLSAPNSYKRVVDKQPGSGGDKPAWRSPRGRSPSVAPSSGMHGGQSMPADPIYRLWIV